ncbi:UNVERIFIED_CONTAM: YTH domain-containing protein ECT3 [Sesamum radiatum]|uniref:YTH domain-containing family protein n=1 Tax=Sesamum radiatum TaxID=300843 RepID=A0AAW2U6H0_SESRA
MMSGSNINLPKQDMGKPSQPISAVSSVGKAISFGIQGASDQLLAAVQGVYYPPNTCYDCYYHGYDVPFSPANDKGYFKTSGFVGIDGKQGYTSSGYFQQLCSYGLDAFPCYAYTGTGSAGAAARSGSRKSRAFPLNPQLQQHDSRSLISPIYQTQPSSPLKKFGFGSPSSDLMTGFHTAGKLSSLADLYHGVFTQYGPVNDSPNDEVCNSNYRYNSREDLGKSGEIKTVAELTRGPRAGNLNNSSKLPLEAKQLAFGVETDDYNSNKFQTRYDSAKFYVIKSYSEVDVHKCIKYDVWSSTLRGNKKLDAGFCEAQAKTNQMGKKSPVFMFFSVNGSGQFVGVAEMIGRVDFSMDMDFWQLDKWQGYFPVKWHIIKDVPNTLLRHIILENNENRPVTNSRDTQEIGLKQGLEMLRIFKSYPGKTSVLDDFNFYEHQEEAIRVKRSTKPPSRTNCSKNSTRDYKVGLIYGRITELDLRDNFYAIESVKMVLQQAQHYGHPPPPGQFYPPYYPQYGYMPPHQEYPQPYQSRRPPLHRLLLVTRHLISRKHLLGRHSNSNFVVC